MDLSNKKRYTILSILFFLPVGFIITMLLSKDNYNPLDIIKKDIIELPENADSLQFNNHLTVLSFLGTNPKDNSIAALNLKELVYDRNKGFKTFQVVVMLPHEAKEEADELLKEIKSYEDLRFWHILYTDEANIRKTFESLRSDVELDENLSCNSVYIIDKDLNQRGRLDDRTDKEIEDNISPYGLYNYDCIKVAVLKNKMAAEDMRVLFKEYRDKRKGKFNESQNRREKDLTE
ncbi:hypothetical protein [Winogradskyella sp. PE311]|uniref:hypothetical protein n=1 Tax=Winogradskyella sp. PE311 TaxID=3366943 RepID=UPI00398147ED